MADYEEIPQKAIESLMEDPSKAGGFDSVFGKGRAAEVLASRDPQPEPKAEKSPEMGMFEMVWDVTGRAVGSGAERAVNETADALDSFDKWATGKLDNVGIPSRLQLVDKEGNFDVELKYGYETDMTAPSYGDFEVDVIQDPETLTGSLVSGVAQFGVGMIGAGKFTKLAGLRGAFVNGAIADAVVFDPNHKNVMGMLDQWGVNTGKLGEVLATDPEDPEYINRLRNVAEGVVAGGIVEGIGYLVKARAARVAGDAPSEARLRAQAEESLRPLDDLMQDQALREADEAKATLRDAKEMFGDDFARSTRVEVSPSMQKQYDDLVSGASVRDDIASEIQPVKDAQTFVRAENLPDSVEARVMADDGPTRVVPIDDLRTTQGFVTPEGSFDTTLPKIVDIDGDLVIRDGNHRVNEARARGETTIEVRVTPESNRAASSIDPDGQLNMNLGDTPAMGPRGTTEPGKNRIYLPPEKAEKIRLQSNLAKGASLDGKLTDMSWRSPNTMKDWDEVSDEIAGISAVLKEEFSKAKGGDRQRLATVQMKAASAKRHLMEKSNDPEGLMRSFQETYSGDPDGMAAAMIAREDFARSMGEELRKMAKGISDDTFHPSAFPGYRSKEEFKMGFDNMLEVYANVLAGNNANRANIARTMRAMQVARKPDKGIQNILSDPAMFRDIETKARAIADPANADAAILGTRDAAMSKAHGWMDQVNKFRINALLSGPGTQEINIVSNMINSFVIPAQEFAGGAIKGDVKMMGHATRTVQGYMAGMVDSLDAALRAGWWNDAILDPHSLKLEDNMLLKGTTAYTKTITLPSRGLMTMDEFFKQSQYRGRVFADANSLAQSKRLKGAERTAFIKNYVADSFDEAGGALREDALLQSRRSTFTEPLEAKSFGASIQEQAIKHPTLRFVIPFVRTPINLLSQTFQHAPILGKASRRYQADIAAGGARAAQARGRQIIGTALVGIAGVMAAQGMVTGKGPSDPRVRRAWMKNNQPYSFRIPQEDGTVSFVSFARLEPLSNIFSISADAVEIMNDEYNENEVTNVLHALTLSVMDNTINKTFTQGVYDAMSLFASNRPYDRERAARNMVASFVPSVFNQLNGDEAFREARTYTDAIMARTGMYNGVDPKRDVMGEVVTRTLPKYDPLGLFDRDNREIDPVLEEITRVATGTQSVSDQPSKKIPGPNNIDLTEIRSDNNEDQTLYDEWIEKTGTTKINGKTLREKLTELVTSRDYLKTPDGDINVSGRGTKSSRIRAEITAYREKAKSELPQLMELIIAEKKGTGELLQMQSRRNRELFPSKFDSEGIFKKKTTFEDLLKQ